MQNDLLAGIGVEFCRVFGAMRLAPGACYDGASQGTIGAICLLIVFVAAVVLVWKLFL
jgi:hypothetical protein